ncbi:indolepyruvate ferredoxin oxidoreductase subunit alpha [Desulfurispira natronophila]|uniref:Indolepyruvate oxidoreductase subunit IorA n=1 Tax=Desulfurispira natronophila TaxID=682562 RepID=A0A7W7Y545_9BACT|nr:indolepyruvate ferredoxin oxidoreductase subunit alpha [Desulfurispira natronophila]MBB5022265.1 indolepyruvate ferredoxin oxidoreductase alpha subunit [Desulfurispira natronophila]
MTEQNQASTPSTRLLSGNEAIALAARDAGVSLAAGYPGTPSTEILENIAKEGSLYCEWAPNEKVALEVCIGASFTGARTLCTTKHVGLNVAADPLFTAAYTGVRGGLVIICADDPGMHSSQNEQDNRHYARAAKILMLEPADANEAYHFTRAAFELSERFDIPVLVRTTTRINHGKGVVQLQPAENISHRTFDTQRDPQKLVMIPAFARMRHEILEASLERMATYASDCDLNTTTRNGSKVGVITSGVSYAYVREVVPADWSILKLGFTHPLPETLISDFCCSVDEVVVVEELDPYLEDTVRRLGFACKGKELFGRTGELNPDIIAKGLGLDHRASDVPAKQLPPRPPVLCPGCPHRGPFTVLKKLDVFVSGDIGCYTLGVNKPLDSIHACVCMGASIGMAHGMDRVLSPEQRRKVVAVIGDSTFLHTGINALVNMVYNRSTSTVFILDNSITAMTGQQGNPGFGPTLMGEPTANVNMEELCRAMGVKHVYKADAFDTVSLETLARREVNRDELSVIIVERECILAFKDIVKPALEVNQSTCIGCRACLKVGCPALIWHEQNRKVSIDPTLCTGCNICVPECPVDAIITPKKS